MLVEALRHLVRGIVNNPEAVRVYARRQRRGECLEIRVHEDDLGRIIGRSGRTVNALRTVISAISDSGNVRLDVNAHRRR